MKTSLLAALLLIDSFFVVAVSLIFSTPAHAYLDGGTISFLLQCLIGGLAVVVAGFSLYWKKFINFFRSNKEEEKSEEKTKDQESE